MRFTLLLLVPALSACASMTESLIPGNKNSEVTENEFVCLQPVYQVDEAALVPLLLAPAVKGIAGFVIDQAAGAIEQESKLYKATYSARVPARMFARRIAVDDVQGLDGKTQRVTKATDKLKLVGIKFARFAGDPTQKECPTGLSGAVMTFETKFDVSEGDVLKITPTAFTYEKSKAKVAAWDDTLDVSVQVALTAVSVDKEGKKANTEVARVDFPMGKTCVGKKVSRDAQALKHLESGWNPLPAFAAPKDAGDYGLVSILVTVMEADNLGDVLARGAKSLRDDKSKLIDKLLKALDIKDH